MFNEAFIRKYFKIFIVILLSIFIILGFLWINVIYSKHVKDSKNYETKLEGEVFNQINQKIDLYVNSIQNRVESAEISLDDTFENINRELRYQIISGANYRDIVRYIDRIKEEYSIDISIKSQDINIGFDQDKFLEMGNDSKLKLDQNIFKKYQIGDYQVVLKSNLDQYIYKSTISILNTISRMDKNIIVFDRDGNSEIQENQRYSELNGSKVDADYFVSVKKIDSLNISLGYKIIRSAVRDVLKDRDELFKDMLITHIYELTALIIIIAVTATLLFNRLKYYADKKIEETSDKIIEVYDNGREIFEEPKLHDFAFKNALQHIVYDSRQNIAKLKEENEKLRKKVRNDQVELLLLKRQISMKDEEDEFR